VCKVFEIKDLNLDLSMRVCGSNENVRLAPDVFPATVLTIADWT
jgi:hypothetical protein